MLGANPLKVVESCHVPPSLRYSQPEMRLSVILVVVLDAKVGTEGAAWMALVTVAVGLEVTLPSQLAAVISTEIELAISSSTKV